MAPIFLLLALGVLLLAKIDVSAPIEPRAKGQQPKASFYDALPANGSSAMFRACLIADDSLC